MGLQTEVQLFFKTKPAKLANNCDKGLGTPYSMLTCRKVLFCWL